MRFYCDDDWLAEFTDTDLLAMYDLEELDTAKERLKEKIKNILLAHRKFYRDRFLKKHKDFLVKKQGQSESDFILGVCSQKDYQNYKQRQDDKQKLSREKAVERKAEVERKRAEKKQRLREEQAKHNNRKSR